MIRVARSPSTADRVNGVVFGLQCFSIDDGSGIRTAVFLKGCNMKCSWCHNPESLSEHPELMYTESKCVMCGACADVCPKGVHRFVTQDGKKLHIMERGSCTTCAKCEDACVTGALALAGQLMSAAEVVESAGRDIHYYRTSGGGITLTGGEPMSSPAFALAIAKAAHAGGISVAMETNGTAPYNKYEDFFPYVDIFLVDYKMSDEISCLEYTGGSVAAVIENMDAFDAAKAKMVLRCPIIPGINDNDEHFAAIAELTKRYDNMLGFEIMPYHKLGTSKARRLGREAREYPEPDARTKEAWIGKVKAFGGAEWGRKL